MKNRKIREPIRERNKTNSEHLNNMTSKKSPSFKSKSQEDTVASKVEESNLMNSSSSPQLGKIWLFWIFKVVLVTLAVLFILLMIIITVNFFSNSSPDNFNTNESLINNSNQSQLSLNLEDNQNNNSLFLFKDDESIFEIIIIKNENCKFCQVNQTKVDLEEILVSLDVQESIEFTTINHNSSLAKEVLQLLRNQGLDFDFTPLFLLPSSIEDLELFEEADFRSLFIEITNDDFYILNPQITTIKYLNSQFSVPQNSISFGNLAGVPITFIYDYNCPRCQVMNGNKNDVDNYISLNSIEEDYIAPIPELLLSLINVESSNEDEIFNIKFIPAPVSPNSEITHRAIFCATNQDLFIPMHIEFVEIHNGSTQLSVEQITELAQNSIPEMNIVEFEDCINSEDTNNFINETYQFLRNYGVTSLPLTIIGNYPVPELIDYETLVIFLQSEFSEFGVKFN
ncbi:MAG: DsbA family protein [Candidatus Woesearchaeota archaeon]